MTSSPQRILVLRYRFIGDTVLMTPFLRQLRHQHPQAIIDVLVERNSGELLTHCPYIDTLIYWDKSKSLWGWGRHLKQHRYDVAYVLKRSWSSALLALFCGANQRIGFNTEGRSILLTQPIPYDTQKHEALCFLDTLPALNPADTVLELFNDSDAMNWANTIISNANTQCPNRPHHVGIHITASNLNKDLPLSFWTELIGRLLAQETIQLHALGAPQDFARYEALRETLPQTLRPLLHNYCGHTTLLQSQALISQYMGFLGVDSGLLHIAAAAQVPSLGYYLPEKINKWAASPTPGQQSPKHLALTSNHPDYWLKAWKTIWNAT